MTSPDESVVQCVVFSKDDVIGTLTIHSDDKITLDLDTDRARGLKHALLSGYADGLNIEPNWTR